MDLPAGLAVGDVPSWDGARWGVEAGGQRWVSRQTLTSGSAATYTKPAGVTALHVRGCGPGGGGGAADGTGGLSAGSGGGGGAGGSFDAWLTGLASAPSTGTYTIGAKGAGGVAGPNAGSNGTAATTFLFNGITLTGNLGVGGAALTVGTALAEAAGGAGGTATISAGTALLVTGQDGTSGLRSSGIVSIGGSGGSSLWGMGGAAVHYNTANAATGYGSGGGGTSTTGATDRAGGDGADGIIIVDEYA